MDAILEKILEKIETVAIEEEKELSSIGKDCGIFDMPELAFAYVCGKSIMKKCKDVFGQDDVIWQREIDLGNGGPTDLVFRLQHMNRLIAIEFKMRDKIDKYLQDVEKLLAINPDKVQNMQISRIFCAVVDSFAVKKEADERIAALDSDPRLRPFKKERLIFETKQKWYSSPVVCVLCFWEVVP